MSWLTWPLRCIGFFLWFAKEMVTSSAAVLKDNLTPGQNSTPGITAFDSQCRNDYEITLLAALITLTPGTLTLGLNSDSAVSPADGARPAPAETGTLTIYVHGMYAGNADAMREELRDMETRMLRGIRREGAPS
ncbi:Na+/H+ antiporter subunit E [Kocuria sp. cx-455]|uniref:Na+/H+ antiporter subunit E n=1 Tax=unclassified Candidatus Sulfotelmatobacter TaxID=2635724 RepID=UPI001689FB4F|nr:MULTISPECIES: Na+/H+ antiporter subunit E [unclassified Candidatus Sulfotelmatobacter]MBD2763416.1 Na+/H+ antiporter subunit E [Kocuria sp. cx-116]MBD2765640.1 Na+/H+ antiporter subunit E [Kocuria sp. cx-455]